MKVEVLKITKFSHESADFFAGAHIVSGYSIQIEWFESFNGFFYVGNAWRGVPKAGETATINFTQAKSEAEALFELQYHVETINVEAVRKSETWLARTKYYSQDWEEFASEEAAKEAAYNPSAVKKGETTFSAATAVNSAQEWAEFELFERQAQGM